MVERLIQRLLFPIRSKGANRVFGMAGKSPVRVTAAQVRLPEAKAGGVDRAEADRARSILLTLKGWTSSRIAEAFEVREDTVRF